MNENKKKGCIILCRSNYHCIEWWEKGYSNLMSQTIRGTEPDADFHDEEQHSLRD